MAIKKTKTILKTKTRTLLVIALVILSVSSIVAGMFFVIGRLITNYKSTSEFALTINKSGTGAGTVTSSPHGINCGSESVCVKKVNSNISIVLKAVAKRGSTFVGWSGDCSGIETCHLKLNASKNVTATFNVIDSYFTDNGTVTIFAHQDDDLLWMLPFWQYTKKFILAAFSTNRYHEEVVDQIPYFSYEDKWKHPIGYEKNFGTYISKWLIPGTSRNTITVENVKEKIRPFIVDQNTKRIITHNNWGEYGHLHHRIVNQAVRELAVEYGKDVWCLSVKIPSVNGNTDPNQYVNTGAFGMVSVDLNFDHAIFTKIRSIYQKKEQKLIGMNQWDWTNIWSWGDGEYQYPSGMRKFIKIVDRGNDLTVGNSDIQKIADELPKYGI